MQAYRLWRDRIESLPRIRHIICLLWNSGPLLICESLVVRVILAGGPPLGAYIGKRIINGVLPALNGHSLPATFWRNVVYEFLIVFTTQVAARVVDYADSLIADQYTHHVSLLILEHAAGLDLSTFEDSAFHNRLEQARSQVSDRLPMIQGFGRLLQFALQIFFYSLILLTTYPWVFLLLMASSVPSFLGEAHLAFMGFTKNKRHVPLRRYLQYIRNLGGSREAAKEARIFQLYKVLIQKYKLLSRQIVVGNHSFYSRRLLYGGLLSATAIGGYYASFIAVIIMSVDHRSDIGTFTLICRAIQQMQVNLQAAFSAAANIADDAMSLSGLALFLAEKPTIVSPREPREVPRPLLLGIEFINVYFKYPHKDEYTLNGVSFTIRAGERVALVGENGSGKSTLVKLLTRLYDPSSGTILIDGADLRSYDLSSVRNAMGVMFQDFMKYEMTVQDNIVLGSEGVHATSNDVLLSATQRALCHAFIVDLPGGYDQILGPSLEGGTDLSGGQWQRIAIARALFKNAEVLILDEPTSSLDGRTEGAVLEKLAAVTRDRTTILISHRLTTAQLADRVVVLANGMIVEEGTHNELAARAGAYTGLFEI